MTTRRKERGYVTAHRRAEQDSSTSSASHCSPSLSGSPPRLGAGPEENLWRVAEDPAAEETARVGAAVALRTRLDREGRARLLCMSDASVSPRVRVALRAAATAEGEGEEALAEAPAAYEADPPRQATSWNRG